MATWLSMGGKDMGGLWGLLDLKLDFDRHSARELEPFRVEQIHLGEIDETPSITFRECEVRREGGLGRDGAHLSTDRGLDSVDADDRRGPGFDSRPNLDK